MRRPGRVFNAVGAAFLVAVALSGCTDDGDGELSVEEYCRRVVEIQPLDDQFGQIETLELQDTYDELDELASTAPDEIRPSLRTLADYVGEVVGVLDDVRPGDTEAAAEALLSITTAEESASIEAAGREVENYTQTNCRFDLRSGGTLPPTTAPPETAPPETQTPGDSSPPTTG